MLTRLAIRDVVLIEALDLDFRNGLGVLTGETGAGKSILLDALGLVLGRRADSGLVRVGARQAVVTASFELPGDHAVATLLEENGLAGEPGEPLTLRRIVKVDGGSRATINDQPASAGLLREIGAHLVEIHGQHDDRGLLAAGGHRDLLDAFGGIDRGGVARAHRTWRAAETRLAGAREAIDTAARDREWLAHAVAELDALGPQPGEEVTLAEERAAMQKGARLTGDLAHVVDHLGGADGALAALRQAARRLDRIAPEHALLASALAAIDRAVIEAAEAEAALADAAETMRCDPARLETIETRLFALRGLARKHRVAPDDLATLAAELGGRLAAIDGGGTGLARLEGEAAAARETYVAAAEALTAARGAAAARLDEAVAAELPPLKLDTARFRTLVAPLPEVQWSALGADRVEFLIATNPGAPFGALTRIASGGELSRFILALKVALAEAGAAATMIFDEIDRGVGGAVANAIGERLARLAARTQLLVVTHSPQVASRAARHWLIAKAHDGRVTRTSVQALSEVKRREEIARMLSGAQVTNEARAQARRLLAA
ncbi:MAG: DNA repair protein RecN [Sphingomonadaceae bacterium]|nr:DNA repair protein RecN [Sphingomonadaceae bacterium]